MTRKSCELQKKTRQIIAKVLHYDYLNERGDIVVVAEHKKRVMITVSKEIADKLELVAEKNGLSKSALITVWVNQEVKKA